MHTAEPASDEAAPEAQATWRRHGEVVMEARHERIQGGGARGGFGDSQLHR